MRNLSGGKQRIFSGVIIIAVLLPVFLVEHYIVAILALLGIVAFGELLNTKAKDAGTASFKGIKREAQQWGILVWITLFTVFMFMLSNQGAGYLSGELGSGDFEIITPIMVLVGAFVIMATSVFSKTFDSDDAGYVFTVMIIIVAGFRALVWLAYEPTLIQGTYWALPIVFVIVTTFLGDVWAYVCGRAFGKHKLIPRVSPKKTWEGAIGSFFLTTLTAVGLHYLFKFNVNVTWPLWFTIVSAAAIMAVGAIGDLVFSKIKRDHDIKDFSNLLPGHGGVLDRFDSTFFTAVLFFVMFTVATQLGLW